MEFGGYVEENKSLCWLSRGRIWGLWRQSRGKIWGLLWLRRGKYWDLGLSRGVALMGK